MPWVPIGVGIRGSHARQGPFFHWPLSTTPICADLQLLLLLTSAPICLWWEERFPRLVRSQQGKDLPAGGWSWRRFGKPPGPAPLEAEMDSQKAMPPPGNRPQPQPPQTITSLLSLALSLPAGSLSSSACHPNKHASFNIQSPAPPSPTPAVSILCPLHPAKLPHPPPSSSPLRPAALPYPNPEGHYLIHNRSHSLFKFFTEQ